MRLLHEKRALLRGALRGFSGLAARDPDAAYALTKAVDQGTKNALIGALTGGVGGYAIADEGDEEEMALRGALLGGGVNALRGLYQGGSAASAALRDPRSRAQLGGQLRDLQLGGSALGRGLK